MKKIALLLLSALLLAGCGQIAPQPEQDRFVETTNMTDPKEELRNIAYAHAGVDAAQVHDVEEELTWGCESGVYKLEFEVRGAEYVYRLDPASGEILYSSHLAGPEDDSLISAHQAKKLALEHAGLTEGAVKNLRVEYEAGIYDVEFFARGIEYEYDIDAASGQILEAEKD